LSRHWLTIEVREPAQCAFVGNPLTKFAIVPVLDAHQNQRAQHLLRRHAAATRVGLLQTPHQIAADLFDYVLLVVKKIRNRLQQRLKAQRIYIELVNAAFPKAGGTAEQFRDGIQRAVDKGWMVRHESGTHVKFTPSGAELFA
jgi:hypothetical protein